MEKYVNKNIFFICIFIICITGSCKKETSWIPGVPFPKEKLIIGVIHINNPFTETSGYSFAHEAGIEDMIKNTGIDDSQVIRRVNVYDGDSEAVEEIMRSVIARGANVIIATSWRYMDTCEKLSREFPSVVFAHALGNKYNDTNFTNYFGRAYQAKYLSGIIAGLHTKTGKIGYIAPWGTDNGEVTCNLNAFAMGVEKANPDAKVYVRITHSWFDPIEETMGTQVLINADCDIISQDTDSPVPQIEAQRAGIWGIGYNTDMSADAPDAVLTSVFWNWGVYYTALIQSIIDGTFTTEPVYGSIKDGIVDLTPLNKNIEWDAELLRILDEERTRIESGSFKIFTGIIETNEGRLVGRIGEDFFDIDIRNNINWYYKNIVVIK